MPEIVLWGAASVLAAGILGGISLVSARFSVAIQKTAFDQGRSSFPKDIGERMDALEREQHNFIEAADAILDSVETKRRRIAAADSKRDAAAIQAQPQAPQTDEQIRNAISAGMRVIR